MNLLYGIIMKSMFVISLVLLFCITLNVQTVCAEEQSDSLSSFIQNMFQRHQGITLCSDPSVSTQSMGTNVYRYLESNNLLEDANPQIVATAIWTLYPCPFSPNRAELAPATSEDIEGVWLFPESSQKLRFGPASSQKSPAGSLPVTCEAVGYYSNGELRNAIFAGKQKCPFQKVSDLDESRKNPRVSDWSLLRNGRVIVTRTDVGNHIEEWDVYIAKTSFSANDTDFNKGDLLAYLRKAKGNTVNASTQFRHLKRLN
ncbi:hypothetical protein LA52FAK_32630 [Desulforhopalus sp. 52FAK]